MKHVKHVRRWAAAALAAGVGATAGCGPQMTPSSPSPAASVPVVSVPVVPVTTSPASSVIPLPASATTTVGKAGSVSLAFVEFQYSPGDRWFYAPVGRLSADAASGVTVTTLSFEIPGVGGGKFCGGWHAAAGGQIDFFREIYGDYELTIDNPGHRATAGTATGTFEMRDDAGAVTTMTATAPIVSGALPTTYTGGTAGGFSMCR